MIKLYGLKIATSKDVYEPAEDTFLLVDNLEIKDSDEVLEVGPGSGLVSLVAAKTAKKVTAIDINPKAVKLTKKNAKTNKRDIEVLEGDLFKPIKARKFDVIIFNAPYLPHDQSDQVEGNIEFAWKGGKSGRETTERFIAEAPAHLKQGGKIYLVDSSLADYDKSVKLFELLGFQAKVIATEKFDFEEIAVIRAKR